MDKIPKEVTLLIMDYLDLKSIAACRQISHRLKFLVDTNRRLWIRELRKLKFMKIYYDPYKSLESEDSATSLETPNTTVIEAFPDWKNIFDYYENEAAEGKLDKVREFVCALQWPYNYLVEEEHENDKGIMSPLHLEAYRGPGRHKLIHILVDSPADFNCKDKNDYSLLHTACGAAVLTHSD